MKNYKSLIFVAVGLAAATIVGLRLKNATETEVELGTPESSEE